LFEKVPTKFGRNHSRRLVHKSSRRITTVYKKA